jgi:hypothetical protein
VPPGELAHRISQQKVRDCLQFYLGWDRAIVPVVVTGALTLATLAAIAVFLAMARGSTWYATVGFTS